MTTAFAILDVALHCVAALATYLWIQQRLKQVEETFVAPILEPDPRVDELMRVVGSLRGAEALKQTLGKRS